MNGRPMSATPEPPDGTILAWRDPAGDLYAVFARIDKHADGYDDTERWWNADQFNGAASDEPLSFDDLLDEMSAFTGPIELVEVPA